VKLNRSHIALNLGTLLEYYDFVIFSMLAKSIMESLFPQLGQNNALLHFLFFSLGGVFRLLGGAIFGTIGDFFGRRTTFLYITISMSIATFCIGMLPFTTNSFINLFLLFSLRAIQSLSFGGEIPSASTFTYETEVKKKRGSFIGLIFSGASVGAVFATATLSLLTLFLSTSQMISWGWRLPFILGGTIGFLTLFLRNSLKETDCFTKTIKTPHKKIPLLKKNLPTLLFASSILIFPLSLVMLNIYLSFYLPTYFSVSLNTVYSTQTLGLIAAIFVAPLAGWLTRFFSLEKLLLSVSLSFAIVLFSIINLAIEGTYLSLSIFFIVWQTLQTSCIVWSMLYALAKIPIEIRSMSMGIIYNFSAMLAGLVPTIISVIYSYFNNNYLAFYVAAGIGIFSASSLLLFKNKKNF